MELLTIRETAQMLRVNPITIRRFIADGRLQAVRVGRGVRPMTWDDPMSKLVGSATDAPPTDSSRKYEYLADAMAPETP